MQLHDHSQTAPALAREREGKSQQRMQPHALNACMTKKPKNRENCIKKPAISVPVR
jgi:hypothetical protein